MSLLTIYIYMFMCTLTIHVRHVHIYMQVSNIGLKWFRHFKADGAAQKYARLMAGQKVHELKAWYTPQQLKALTPQQRHQAFWFVVTNCAMHNVNLGGTHAAKAMAKITEELAVDCVDSMKAAGFKSNSFNHCPILAQCIHTATKFFSCGEGYAFGKVRYVLCH